MKIWKVILATLVIFAAGVITGGVLTRHAASHPPPHSSNRQWTIHRPEFFQRMNSELALTAEQTNRLDTIIRKSYQRTEPLWDLINPLLQEEMTRVRTEIKAELKPEQQAKFEELLKPRYPKRPEGEGPGHPPGGHSRSHSRPPGSGSGTNAPVSAPATPPTPGTNPPSP